MAKEITGFILSLPASGDLSSSQYLSMVVNSSGEAAAAGVGAKIAGILQNKPDAAGKAASVQVDQISKYIAGTGGVTAGDELEAEAGGKLVTLSTGASVGIALETTAADGIGTVLLK